MAVVGCWPAPTAPARTEEEVKKSKRDSRVQCSAKLETLCALVSQRHTLGMRPVETARARPAHDTAIVVFNPSAFTTPVVSKAGVRGRCCWGLSTYP